MIQLPAARPQAGDAGTKVPATQVPPHFFGLAQRNGCGAPKKNALVRIVGGNCLLRVSACREWSSRYRMGVQHRRPRLASLRSRRWVCGNSKPPLPCRGGGACAAGDGGVLGLCASLLRTADFRHPSGRACARPPPLQCRGGLGSRPLSAATAGRNARTAMQKTHSPTG